MTNLAENLTAAAAARPDALALKCDDLEFSYAAFDDASARFATYLAEQGIEPGDRVGIMLPNTPAFAIVFYGIMRRGAVAVPMNPLLKAAEVEYYLANTGSKALFATPVFADDAEAGARAAGAACHFGDDAALATLLAKYEPTAPVEPRDGDDTAVILHTSGTTGKPKGAELTHQGLGMNCEISGRTLLHLTGDDVMMGCLPLFHVFGLTCGLNAAVRFGSTLTLIPRFEPRKAIEVIGRDKVTVFLGVPTMYAALVAALQPGDDVSSLRACGSGGAALPLQVITDFEAAFNAIIMEGYGLSETSPVACFNHPDKPRKPGTIGTPIEGVQMRCVDDSGNEVPQGERGEVQVRGHNIMKGYWNLPEATADAIDADGWFSTGDIGIVDADGYFSIVDRKKEMIIRGGLNVYPREIEEVLYGHPAVAEAAVVGIPHDTLGEEVGAAIALKAGVALTVDEIRDYVKERVASYKYPRHVWLLAELPKNATGKVQKRDIAVPDQFTA
ncbi:AMP-dependent synthetase and ligase OS=Tsukamurella paurometabola (strain ATCC 8368 / DSM /CCUG 35730 / CIP 100753 / JCM 10117 / KCTC 9821 / NBRC 16120/ NCIMB 702349 / NCTC 13040) OX=521096 GN=Tpau_3969 PE=3 SV=1 [Tsukamurella paurometabola]|uniref:AMP-dependent synthetase and ligase n=1 Tax=Tsukamurella paurometabola (strain ATCC 8368 / DSM 20162 / CCUG 35730 / CIP 100753 / JCM 10117 / KCTC 9821 / NBRC 16120 / NCIMB 702349 / NCTC 13040) TaxID=521096 RepID=D5UMR6_TSUPD|nr:long-chain fatty acid--CoA ligase [Tsukamurella paurometabola]ADG80540.1 AMP-dependent synthetase and ligase [Tsukamurella paurometabola DSM 20162]SUP40022.1 Long-chain-fatty-acid--CoA ligase [Tsukamurella paurometabola]